MHNQPHVKQKEIADTMGITIQAISKYFKKLTKEGLIEAGSGRADYHLTRKGIGKLHDDLKSLERYVTFIRSEIKIEHAWPAIATQPIKAGQTVALIVKEGVMYTVDPNSPVAELKGIAMADAAVGEDLGLRNLQGKMNLKHGKILIVKLPSIRQGGSRAVDIGKIQALYEESEPEQNNDDGGSWRSRSKQTEAESRHRTRQSPRRRHCSFERKILKRFCACCGQNDQPHATQEWKMLT